MQNTPVALVDLSAIRANFELARRTSPRSKIMAVVKADAYGHGAVQVCHTLVDADAFSVARVAEGVVLREADVDRPIIVLEGFIDREELEVARINRLTPVLHSDYQVAHMLGSPHTDMPVWVKVDTGMHRLGFSVEEFRAGMSSGASLNVVGVMSHLANAHDPGHAENRDQIEIFNELTHDLSLELSIANSGAILDIDHSHFDWIRPGIMLYGGSSGRGPDTRLKAGMTLAAPVVSVREIMAGESIGYASSWVAEADTRVAVIGIGYADGYPREAPVGTPILIGGNRRGIVGRISMDLTYVQLEPDDVVVPGDSAVMWGPELPVDEVAECIGTIGYTLMSSLTRRVARQYTNG